MRWGIAGLAVVLMTGCGSGSTPAAAPSVVVTSTAPSPSPYLSPTAPASPAPVCPNQESGGSCLGRLAAGSHESSGFAVPLSYVVPAGWSNEEDINGRYLLLPPGSSRTGADEPTTDYLGVYDPVAVADGACGDGGQQGVGTTPAAIVAALRMRHGLRVTAARPVTLGTLRGEVVDVRLLPGWKGTCEGGEPLVPVLYGGRLPETFSHDVISGMVMRLYLLATGDATVVVEIDALGLGRQLAALDAVARSVRFL